MLIKTDTLNDREDDQGLLLKIMIKHRRVPLPKAPALQEILLHYCRIINTCQK